MSSADLILFCGQMLSAWVLGFSAGYILTRFREAVNQTV